MGFNDKTGLVSIFSTESRLYLNPMSRVPASYCHKLVRHERYEDLSPLGLTGKVLSTRPVGTFMFVRDYLVKVSEPYGLRNTFQKAKLTK